MPKFVLKKGIHYLKRFDGNSETYSTMIETSLKFDSEQDAKDFNNTFMLGECQVKPLTP